MKTENYLNMVHAWEDIKNEKDMAMDMMTNEKDTMTMKVNMMMNEKNMMMNRATNTS